jgi:hypothetical protein
MSLFCVQMPEAATVRHFMSVMYTLAGQATVYFTDSTFLLSSIIYHKAVAYPSGATVSASH